METYTISTGINALGMGLMATAILDLWAQFLKRVVQVSPTNWRMVGRWFAHLSQGHFQYASISEVAAVRHEGLLGWVLHYVVGISYALIFLFVSDVLSVPVTFLSALMFGVITVLAPWLILQPGLGLGRFASNTANPVKTRALNILSHTVFGSGLYIAWILVH